jgi:hypothetical protein
MYLLLVVYQLRKQYLLESGGKGAEKEGCGIKLVDSSIWEKVLKDVKGCVDFIRTTAYASGNYPLVVGMVDFFLFINKIK